MKDFEKNTDTATLTTPFISTWDAPLPEDEIARQQRMKELLHPGCEVELQFEGIPLGRFRYAGIWDTMHSFYPLDKSVCISDLLSERGRRYRRRDLRGNEYILIPYTLLADVISKIMI